MKIIIIMLCCVILLNACVVVEAYEKINLNDPDMLLGDKKCDENLLIVHFYREGTAGANGGKTGGGCGCN